MAKQEIRADLLLGRDTLSPGLIKAGEAASSASGNIKQLTRDLYEVSRQRATPVVDLQDAAAEAKLKDVTAKLKELGARAANPEIDVDDKQALADVAAMRVKLDTLGAKVSSPRITLDGLARAEAQLLVLDVALDKIDARHVTAHVKVDVDRRGLGASIGGLLGAGVAGIGRSIPGLGGLLSTPQGAIATLVAALGTLPFAAAAAAGGIVSALGGGIAAVAVIFAAKNKQIQREWSSLTKTMGTDMRQISRPFVGVLGSILDTAKATLPKIMGPLGDAIKSVAGPFQTFVNTLVRSFGSPAVAKSIRDLGGAFGEVLKALAPSLPSIINSIARGIDGIAQAIKAHPKIFADLINFLGHLVGWSLQAIGALTRVAAWLVQFARDVGHWLRVAWDAFSGFFRTAHNGAVAFQNAVVATFRAFWHNTVAVFSSLRRGAADVWDAMWRNTVTRVRNGISDVVSLFRGLPGRALGALRGLGHSLYAFAHAALTDFLSGFRAVAGAVLRWIGGFVSSVINAVKRLLHIGSPSAVFHEIGVNMMLGLERGIKASAHRAANAAKSAAQGALGGGSSGALGGDAAANKALARRIFPWGAAQWPAFVQLEMMEAGFNRFARNPSSGAYGIPQALPPTKMPFAAQAAGGSHAGPQLGWMFNYIAGRYGNPVNALGHELSYHWYDRGGWLPPGLSLALNTSGRPEQVISGRSGGSQVVVLEIRSSGRRADDLLVELIRDAVRVRGGGNVQVALGKRN